MRLSLGLRFGGRGGGAGGGQAVEATDFGYVERWESLAGWTDLATLDPDEFSPCGLVEPNWLGMTDETATADYPDSFPAIGGRIRPFDPHLLSHGFTVEQLVSGIHPIEATPLLIFGHPDVSQPNAFGYGGWLGHDFEFLGIHLGPGVIFSGMGYPPDDAGVYTFTIVVQPHVDGVPYWIGMRYDPDGTITSTFNGADVTSTNLGAIATAADELWLGVAIDAHWCTPNHTPYNIDPVPPSNSRAVSTWRLRPRPDSIPPA